jgi:F-box/TPR repeat protein Pof3
LACARTSLSNTFIKSVTQESIKRGNLKSLSIGDRIFEAEDLAVPAENAYPVSGTVEELSLALLMLSDREVIKIVNLYPNVQKLDVSGTRITGVAVKTFVQLGVKRLKMNECSDVGPDAVEWARGQGIEVEFNFPSRSGNMKGYRDAAFAGGF